MRTHARIRNPGVCAALAVGSQKEVFIASAGGDKDPFAPIPTGHDVVNYSLVFNADLSRQEILGVTAAGCNIHNQSQ